MSNVVDPGLEEAEESVGTLYLLSTLKAADTHIWLLDARDEKKNHLTDALMDANSEGNFGVDWWTNHPRVAALVVLRAFLSFDSNDREIPSIKPQGNVKQSYVHNNIL